VRRLGRRAPRRRPMGSSRRTHITGPRGECGGENE
jgi:hypothetical protein